MFKLLEDVKPKYIVVAFDLKAPTARHKMYEGYKANRKGMPDELAEQMPIIKEILKAMNIDIIEKEGYEADDILGTLSCYGEKQGLDVIILSGDRDTFQLATNKVTIRIPHTKAGKSETDEYNKEKIIEKYGIEPKQLIEVKGLQGDTSDNIPGVPGIGEKTALKLIQEYGTIDNLYKKIEEEKDNLKGKQREKIVENKELAYLSKTLGTINVEVPIKEDLSDFEIEEWDKQKVLEIFEKLRFNRYIERFNLKGEKTEEANKYEEAYQIKEKKIDELINYIEENKEMIFYISTKKQENQEKIIQEEIKKIAIYNRKENEVYYVEVENKLQNLKKVLEDEEIKKIGIDLSKIYILLKQKGIKLKGIDYDISIASYILNPTDNKLKIENLMEKYLGINLEELEEKTEQINLFDENEEKSDENENNKICKIAYSIGKIQEITQKKLEETNCLELFRKIDMPTVEVLSNMQWNGMYVDKEELEQFGKELTEKLKTITKIIYEMAGEEFNINSTKQLGEILFEKMKLPAIKKTKSGYSTDVEVLEKLKKEDPIIEQILEYRQLMKLNSTYVEGLKPYINPKTNRIHSFFHQTITATGRISSTEPNLQNIPTRFELGKRVRKVFKPENGKIYIDADYSQIELRVLASISEDKHMIEAFEKGEELNDDNPFAVWKEKDWVKKWMQNGTRLDEEKLDKYVYFADVKNRYGQSSLDMLSPTARKCYEQLVDGTEMNRNAALKLVDKLVPGEKAIIASEVFAVIENTSTINVEVLRSYTEFCIKAGMTEDALKKLMEQPVSKYNAVACGQLASFISNLSPDKATMFNDYLSTNPELKSTIERQARLNSIVSSNKK